MYWYLVCFSTIVYYIYITPGLGEIKEAFEMNHNSNAAKDIGDLPKNLNDEQKNSFFYTMIEDDRIMYCNEAKDFAGLDAIAPITNTQLKYLYYQVIVECRTLPISYLRTREGKIQILMWNNTFLVRYHYEVQTTNSEPIIYSKSTRRTETKNTKIKVANLLEAFRSANFDNDSSKEVYVSTSIADFLNIIGSTSFESDRLIKDNRLSRLKEDEPIQVCIAAKRHLRLLAGKDDGAHNVPVLQNDQVEPAQIFDFGNEIGEHVALSCPSIPPMHVYFKNPTNRYSRYLKIVLVQN